jgi:prevent-host-death family protein
MAPSGTRVPLSEARARLAELARHVRHRRERIILTRNGTPEAVLLSVDELEGLEITVEILGDKDAVVRMSESMTALDRGEPGADASTVREDLRKRSASGV